jgi:hypothetical protein
MLECLQLLWTSLQVACKHLCHLRWALDTILFQDDELEKHGLWSQAALGLNSCSTTWYLDVLDFAESPSAFPYRMEVIKLPQ